MILVCTPHLIVVVYSYGPPVTRTLFNTSICKGDLAVHNPFHEVKTVILKLEAPVDGKFKYVPSCSYLETMDPVAVVELESYIKRPMTDVDEEDPCDPIGYDGLIHILEPYEGYTDEKLILGMRAEFRMGCHCEYDCCGHYHGGITVLEQVPGDSSRWRFSTHYARNY